MWAQPASRRGTLLVPVTWARRNTRFHALATPGRNLCSEADTVHRNPAPGLGLLMGGMQLAGSSVIIITLAWSRLVLFSLKSQSQLAAVHAASWYQQVKL
jgi:hypothetical protein